MVLQYYNLREQPFGVTPNPRYFYASEVHREALASLICGIEYEVGFAALLSAPGMGKTTLLFQLLEQYRSSAYTVFIFNTQCTRRDLLRSIADELRIDTSDQDLVKLLSAFNLFLAKNAASKPLILVIDEAQNLDDSVLETVRLLSNFETPEHKLLHIILAGQPELSNKLRQPNLVQLVQRITMISRLERLSACQTSEYIRHRLSVAGYSGPELFSREAVSRIAAQSGGVPRSINRICFNALLTGCGLRKTTLDEDVIAEVIDDLDLAKPAAENDDLMGNGPLRTRPILHHRSEVMRPTAVPTLSPDTVPVRRLQPIAARVASRDPVLGSSRSVPDRWDDVNARPVADRDERRESRVAAVAATAHHSQADGTRAVVDPRPVPRPVEDPIAAPAIPKGAPLSKAFRWRGPLLATIGPGRSRILTVIGCTVALIALAGMLLLPYYRSFVHRRASTLAQHFTQAEQPQTVATTDPTLTSDISTPPGTDAKSGKKNTDLAPGATSARKRSRSDSIAADSSGSKPVDDPQPEAPTIVRPAEHRPGDVTSAQPPIDALALNTHSVPPVLSSPSPVATLSEEPKSEEPKSEEPKSEEPNPQLLTMVEPIYPAAAKAAQVEGDVLLSIKVGEDGKVKTVRVLQGNPLLTASAAAAVQQWRYAPHLQDGNPEDTDLNVRVKFRLQQRH